MQPPRTAAYAPSLPALSPWARAELHDAAGGVGVQTGDAGRLGGDQAVEVHGLQQIGLNEDSAHKVALDADHLHMGIADRAFGQSVHVALPAVGAQILAELLAHALGAQPVDILLIEVIFQQKAGQLALACADGIALVVGVLAEEHIEHQRRILEAVQEQAVGHRELVEIHDHGRVIVIFIRNIRNNFDLVHESFLSSYPYSGRYRAAAEKTPRPGLHLRCGAELFHPVMTGCLYHDSIFPGWVQEVL
jgi:hypothetical protein